MVKDVAQRSIACAKAILESLQARGWNEHLRKGEPFMTDVMRVLDVDLDVFLNDVAHWPNSEERLDPDYYIPWPIDEACAFLEEHCGLKERLPGRAVEEHHEVFASWRELVQEGDLRIPFHVTHVDAHADLGLGDAGYVYLMTELLFESVDERVNPKQGSWGLGSGNYLAFAAACRWLTDLTYVYIPGGGSDLLSLHMENYDPNSNNIQLKKIDPDDADRLTGYPKPKPVDLEPLIPIRSVRAEDFTADEPFDLIFLARSPAFTPPTSDELYDVIRERYIAPL